MHGVIMSFDIFIAFIFQTQFPTELPVPGSSDLDVSRAREIKQVAQAGGTGGQAVAGVRHWGNVGNVGCSICVFVVLLIVCVCVSSCWNYQHI